MTTTTKKASDKKDPKKTSKRPLGKTTGVDQRATWRLMLAKGFKEKASDETIYKWMLNEFPHAKTVLRRGVAGVQVVRAEFNRGAHEPNKKAPAVQWHAWINGMTPEQAKAAAKAKKAEAKEAKKPVLSKSGSGR